MNRILASIMLAATAAATAFGFGEVRVDVYGRDEISDPAAPEMRVSRLYVGKPLEKKTASFVSKPLTDQWKKLEFSFVPTQNGRVSLVFHIPGSSNKAMMKPVLLDQVSAVGATVVNGDFEEVKNGRPVGWTLGRNAALVAGESVGDGKHCVRTHHSGSGMANQSVTVKAGEKVTVTFMAKLSAPDAAAPTAPARPAPRKAAPTGTELIRFDSFAKRNPMWSIPKYWGGTAEWENRELVVKATHFKNRFWGRVGGVRIKPAVELAGRRFRITVPARGKGDFKVGFLVVTVKPDGKKLDYRYAFSEPAPLGEKERNFVFDLDLSDTAPLTLSPTVEVTGENSEAHLRNARVDAVSDPRAKMELLTPLAVVPEGTPAPARKFRFSAPDATVRTFRVAAAGPLYRFDLANGQPVCRPEISDDKGEVVMKCDDPITGLVKFTAAAQGASATGFAVGIPAESYRRLAEPARQIPAGKPMSILVIGDSLNDFNRGYNAMDYLESFLNLKQPGVRTVHNYAVAGDYITRVEDRLAGRRKFDVRYRGIFDRKYDLVIIALGNNDCRALSTDNYARPLVDPAEAKASYERVIAMIRKHSDAPVWLCSSSYSNYAQQVERSDRAVKSGRVGVRFGTQAHLDNYNRMLRDLAANGKALRYIELCAPMKAAFSPDNYADGVHLSPQGHRLFAELLLRAFVGQD